VCILNYQYTLESLGCRIIAITLGWRFVGWWVVVVPGMVAAPGVVVAPGRAAPGKVEGRVPLGEGALNEGKRW